VSVAEREAPFSAAPPAASIFNGYVATCIVAALQELGLLEAFSDPDASYTFTELVAASRAAPSRLRAILEAARLVGLMAHEGGRWSLTSEGAEVLPYAGFFGWLVGGYGELFQRLPRVADGTLAWNEDVHRDEAAVALNAGRVDAALMTPILHRVLDTVEFECFADLGCGSGRRLIDLCERYPHVRGLGIDISADACELARDAVEAAGLSHRIQIINRDVVDLVEHTDPRLAEADIVGSFMMLHDLLNAENPERLFPELFASFPNARRYVIADTVVMEDDPLPDELPIFSVAYELAHAFMGTRLFRKREYEELFEAMALRIEQSHPFGAPSTWLYLLRRD
jgi:SAM-dependent methyltransferase